MILPSWQDTLVALHSAQTCEELWTVLVVPHGMASSSAWEEPFGLIARFHRTDAEGTVSTALLTCSDHRWRKGTHRLIHQLAESGMLGDADLDRLAACFLQPELTIAVPRRLFDDQAVILIKPDPVAAPSVATVDPLLLLCPEMPAGVTEVRSLLLRAAADHDDVARALRLAASAQPIASQRCVPNSMA